MRNNLLKYTGAMLLLLACCLTSCIKEDYAVADKASVTLTFTTRANGTTDSNLEAGEGMKHLRVLVVDQATSEIRFNYEREFQENEISATVTFGDLYAGHTYDFYAIANAEYYGVTGEKECLERARAAYDLIWNLNQGLIKDPTGLGPKTIPETRSGRALANPMIYLNITSVLRRVDPEQKALYDERAAECVDEIFRYHFKPEMKCTLESVGPNGEFRGEVTEGRVVNPGHDIECSWFLMEDANLRGDAELHKKAQQVFDQAIEAGWDKEYGGLLYFIDCLGRPPEAYEHDMKLWWPHDETMIASLMLYRDTGDEKYLEWFEKTMDYCKTYFADPEYGEWYGYLRRDGKPTMPPCKGSTFKGPFHLPRMLSMCDQMFSQILAKG